MADLPPNVTLAQLSYFVAVAEELNFTRAAERLHVSQSPLSQAIKALEANLGVVLLERTSRHVELTAAGEELLPAARAAIGAVEHAVNVARAAGQGEQRLRVGFLAFGACDVIDRSLAAFAAPVSDLRLETRQAEFSDPTAGLAAGNVDAAFLRLPVTSPGLELAPLTSEPRVAVLPAWHPLAGRESIAIRDLIDEHWLQMPGSDRIWRDFWLATAHRGGVAPLLGPEVRTIDEQLAATATGGYVSLAPASVASSYLRPGISYVPVAGIEPSAVAIGWRRGDQRESVRRFVTSARALAPITRPEDRAQAQRSD
jgi:DNA-binding transcriptional LysR family regulator